MNLFIAINKFIHNCKPIKIVKPEHKERKAFTYSA